MKFRLLLLIVAMVPPCRAVELQIAHAVIQRVLAQQVFTDEGRKYVRANRASKCSYAYLENPEVGAEGGKLRIRARFSGRSGVDLFGRCFSMGDSFPVVIRATPYYRNGAVWLRAIDVNTENRDGVYIRHVRSALANSLASEFSYKVVDDARHMLEQVPDKSPWHQQLMNFNVNSIQVTQDAIIVNVDFTLAVR